MRSDNIYKKHVEKVREVTDLLSLVNNITIAPEVALYWSDRELEQAGNWAACMHLDASDNQISKKKLIMPKFLEKYL